MIRVLIADDQALVRGGFRSILEGQDDIEDLAQPDANERLIVGDEDARHRTGRSTRTAKPPPGSPRASNRPP